jgi:hypothetical protein
MRNSSKRKTVLPGWAIIVLDVLTLGVALCVFALFHHVLPKYGGGPKLNIVNVQPSGTDAAAQNASPRASGTESDSAAPGAIFPFHFQRRKLVQARTIAISRTRSAWPSRDILLMALLIT